MVVMKCVAANSVECILVKQMFVKKKQQQNNVIIIYNHIIWDTSATRTMCHCSIIVMHRGVCDRNAQCSMTEDTFLF